MEKRKIILDCDPGHDDAVAIMLAGSYPGFELLGITVEAGNQTIEKTVINTLNMVQYLNLNVPVAAGKGIPLKRKPMNCAAIHGESGLDGFEFPKLERKADKRDAVEMIYDLLKEHKHVTLVPTGPLTNIAKVIIEHKDAIKWIDEIVLMGGSIGHGNVTPAAEFNIVCDPEAADIVFNSGIKVKMLGLDVTRKVLVLPEIIEKMRGIHNKISDLFVDLMIEFNKNQKKIFGFAGGPLHDPATIVSLINEDVVKFQYMNVVIDVTGGPSYGRTNCDQFDYLHQKPNAWVAVDIDVDLYWKEVEKGLRRYSK